MKKVFVSGCYDLLHSGHVEFFRQAAQYGDLYVGIGSDATILKYKNHRTLYPEKERLFMVQSIRYVKQAFINQGSGVMDFVPTVEMLKPDRFVVNSDGSSEEKRRFCEERGIEYIVLERTPADGLDARSSTGMKAQLCQIPTRLDLAGTWIDQPYVSCFAPGWAITISLVPDFEVRDRCGLSTSTRKQIQKIWPLHLPDMDAEMLAKLVFCFENDPERSDGIISGAQDAIGICVPGLCRHHYDARYWPDTIEQCHDERVLSWLEQPHRLTSFRLCLQSLVRCTDQHVPRHDTARCAGLHRPLLRHVRRAGLEDARCRRRRLPGPRCRRRRSLL